LTTHNWNYLGSGTAEETQIEVFENEAYNAEYQYVALDPIRRRWEETGEEDADTLCCEIYAVVIPIKSGLYTSEPRARNIIQAIG
jgi:hypothetical protein